MRAPERSIVALMGFAAATLAIASILHLSGVGGGSKPFTTSGAGVAEAVIGVALAAGAIALARAPSPGRRAALAATGFAIFGFIVGLSFTLRGGEPADVIYHLTMLPVLIFTLALTIRSGSGSGTVAGRHGPTSHPPAR